MCLKLGYFSKIIQNYKSGIKSVGPKLCFMNLSKIILMKSFSYKIIQNHKFKLISKLLLKLI